MNYLVRVLARSRLLKGDWDPQLVRRSMGLSGPYLSLSSPYFPKARR